ncbi:MAG TPA: response regulator [Steroidobacteraceae bacterium]|nr:response regulator [Steroidobacteraceae bacterium]
MTASVDILVVEDDPDELDMTLRALRTACAGSAVSVARDGFEALLFIFCEGAYSTRDIRATPRLILLDLALPKVDGFEVLRRLKGDPRTSTIPVVILTSSREYRDIAEGYDAGANSYIVKPVDFQLFVGAVQSLGTYWLSLNQPRQ